MRQAIKQQTIGYITAALGLVAGLAWNQAIQALINHFYPNANKSITAQFIYAVIITIVVVLLTTYMVGIFQKEENAQEHEGQEK